MSWHVDGRTIDAYVDGRIDDTSAFSLEAHVLACPDCRAELSASRDPALRGRAWDGIRRTIDRPREGVLERSLRRVGVRSDLARLLVTIPTFRTSWLLAVGVCLAFAALAAEAIGDGSLPFLVLAPLVPLSGVAAAFGRPIDPVWELGLSAPFGGFRLMLIRATSATHNKLNWGTYLRSEIRMRPRA
jgi:anti-sigma factor RsiW